MTLYVAVGRCENCKEPALGYTVKKQPFPPGKKEQKAFPLTCLSSDCNWRGAVAGSEALALLVLPWEE